MEIEVQREPFFILAASILLVLFGAVGYFASPRAEDGRPVLLMPDVKAVEDYRRAASGWSASWRELDGQMHGVMDAESNSELLVMSRAAQRAFERAVELARSVDSTETPAPLIGLRDQAAAASLAYMDASVAVARWVSAPTPENRSTADSALAKAGAALAALEQNDWIGR